MSSSDPSTPYFQQHQQAVSNGEHFYTDPQSGFLVFTERYHIERGFCCQSACRHCPYDFKKDL